MIPLPDFSDPDDLREACSEARSAGTLKHLGDGAYRAVYSLGDGNVLKVPGGSWSEDAQGCNLREADIWAAVQESPIAEWLAPVIACAEDGSWLIMQEALGGTTRDRPASGQPAIKSVTKSAPLRDGRRLFADDLHSGNVGLTSKGRPVIIDYGNFALESEDSEPDDARCSGPCCARSSGS